MALHWQEIAGFNGTTGGNNSDILYTYIYFQKRNNNELLHSDNRPHIILNDSASGDLGYIVCNNINNNFSEYLLEGSVFDFTTEATTTVSADWPESNSTHYGMIRKRNDSALRINSPTGLKFYSYWTTYMKSDSGIVIEGNSSSTYYVNLNNKNGHTYVHAARDNYIFCGSGYKVQIGRASAPNGYTHSGITSLVEINSDATNIPLCVNSSRIYCSVPINAKYYNATSDKRAKENILKLDCSALELVKKVAVYSFNYKENQKKSIGLIAQDLVNIDLNGFNLVDNLNATGKDGDFMSIHESKLVYVLWKAVQELSNEVENLKQQLNK